MPPIAAVNYHMLAPCDSKCRFCFAGFRDVPGQLPVADAERLITALRAAGAEKITFVGGEPTLHRHLGRLLRHAKAQGFVTCVVTNGFRLDALLDAHADALDWVGLSVDAADESTQAALGRGHGDHIAQATRLAGRCRSLGIRLKLNTVVTQLTWTQDLSTLVREIAPERWKVFQALPVEGQNDGEIEALRVTADQFAEFLARHDHLPPQLAPIAEDNDAMRGSYVMVDPLGRCFGNATGRHVYSEPILDVGVDAALAQVGFVPERFEARGGRYAWGPGVKHNGGLPWGL